MNDAQEVKPFSPEEAQAAKDAALPSYVLSAFNSLLSEKVSGGYARITQNDAVLRIIETAARVGVVLERHQVFADKLLDVEGVYGAQGWHVEYHKQSIGDSGESAFVFRRPAPIASWH